jgi:hypothetical protein
MTSANLQINIQTLRDGVSRFTHEGNGAIPHSFVRREIRRSIQSVIRTISEAGWDAYLVGGTIRDIVLGPSLAGPNAYYPRDIDIVLVGVHHDEIRDRFAHIYSRDTRFGGVHLVDRRSGGLQILYDLWSLENTWAFSVARGIRLAIESFPSTPFLNLDTAVVGIRSRRGRPRPVFENGFIDGINARTIEVNFEPNPFPEICFVRALIMAAKLQFAIGPKLVDFLLRQWSVMPVERFLNAQASHYGTIRCNAAELTSWISAVETQSKARRGAVRLTVYSGRQLALWNDYPPSDLLVNEGELLSA